MRYFLFQMIESLILVIGQVTVITLVFSLFATLLLPLETKEVRMPKKIKLLILFAKCSWYYGFY